MTPFIEVDAQLRTSRRNIFAIGDVNALNMLDSAAASQAQVGDGLRLVGPRAKLPEFEPVIGQKY